MAPLYTKRHEYKTAVQCYTKVMETESDPLKKVEMLTKICGSLKKDQDPDGAVAAGKKAFEVCK